MTPATNSGDITSRWRYREQQIYRLRKVASENIVAGNSRLRQNYRQRLSLQHKFVSSDKICRRGLITSNLLAKANHMHMSNLLAKANHMHM